MPTGRPLARHKAQTYWQTAYKSQSNNGIYELLTLLTYFFGTIVRQLNLNFESWESLELTAVLTLAVISYGRESFFFLSKGRRCRGFHGAVLRLLVWVFLSCKSYGDFIVEFIVVLHFLIKFIYGSLLFAIILLMFCQSSTVVLWLNCIHRAWIQIMPIHQHACGESKARTYLSTYFLISIRYDVFDPKTIYDNGSTHFIYENKVFYSR